jgi:hypothetical protein
MSRTRRRRHFGDPGTSRDGHPPAEGRFPADDFAQEVRRRDRRAREEETDKIATLSLAGLATYADRVYDATPNEYELDSELELALVYALREARSHVADDTRTAGRLEEARRRREGESNDEYAAPHENLGARR